MYRTRYIKTYYRNGSTSQEGPYPQTLVHCNYGWKGSSDGYYSSGVFDLNFGPIEKEKGDNPSNSKPTRYYRYDLEIITYTGLP